jgi:hypothetical protein
LRTAAAAAAASAAVALVQVAKCVAEMEEGSPSADGKIDFPEFLKWWKTLGSKRKKGSIAEKIAARKKAEQEAAAREAEDAAREKEERAARAKEQSEVRRKKAAAKAEAEAARVATEEAEAAAAEEAEKRAAEEKAARWKDRARRERCDRYLHMRLHVGTRRRAHRISARDQSAACTDVLCHALLRYSVVLRDSRTMLALFAVALQLCSEEAEAAKLAEEEEAARREEEFQAMKRKKMEELEAQLAAVRLSCGALAAGLAFAGTAEASMALSA